MIYPTVGIPCRFSEWCETILHEVLMAAGRPPAIFVANKLDQLGKEILARKPSSALVVIREPEKALSEALISTATPITVTLDSPEQAVGALVTDYHERFPAAVRRIASCLTTLLPLVQYENALILRASDRPAAAEVAARMARHFGLGLEEAALRDVAQRLPEYTRQLEDVEAAYADDAISDALNSRAGTRSNFGYGEEDDHTLASIQKAALHSLWAHVNGNALKEIYWHPALFSLGDRPADPPIASLDTTGLRRCLLFGPYIQLPEGPWSCSVLLGCEKSAVGIELTVEIFSGVTLNSMDIAIEEPGLFEIEMSFVNPSPDAHIEVRLISAKPTFEGEILMGSVRFFPQRAKRLRAG